MTVIGAALIVTILVSVASVLWLLSVFYSALKMPEDTRPLLPDPCPQCGATTDACGEWPTCQHGGRK